MSDRRRRRLDDEGEEGGSDPSRNVMDKEKISRPSECESEDEPAHETDLSEYESAPDESGDLDDETGSETESGTETGSDESETETEGGFTDEEGLQEERQSGDGEEQPEGKPDDDEDKKNPAYVPRKGAFYEHDYRQGDEGPDGEEEPQEEIVPKKKLWQDEGKWSHDRYFDDMQAPKSREELIALYGYDIQAADKPPEMPPRKMGRGRGGPRGPRRTNQMQDFMPRMAVIDTTEYGKDSVPNLDDDYVQSESGAPGRRRGGRAGSRGRGITSKDNSGRRSPEYRPGRSSQDARNLDYPSLDEISRQTKMFEDFRNDSKKSYSQQRENTFHSQEKRHENQYEHGYAKERTSGSNNMQRRNYDSGDWKSDNRGSGDVRNQTFDNSNYRNNNRSSNFRKGSHQSEYQRNDSRSAEADSNSRRGHYDSHHQNSQRSLRPETGDYKGRDRDRDERIKHRESVIDANSLRLDLNERGDANAKSSKNVVLSNKENVQTINVTITSTTTEKKSYAKERRAKGANRMDESVGQAATSDHRAAKAPSSQNSSSYDGGSSAPPQSRRFSSQRQQALAGGNFSGPPPLDGTKFYNPALPPPSFYQREPGSVGPPRSPITATPPALLPPAAATLPFGMPVSQGPGLPPPPATGATPAMFQAQRPPPPSALPAPPAGALITPPYLPAGMVYGGGPRVPPPGAPAAFPVPLAYTSPPPTTAASVPQAPQASTSQHTETSSQGKKVYRGDIIYYAPELQQPSRTPQKRPKAAIPIVNPQAKGHQKHKEDEDEVNEAEAKKQPECSTNSDNVDSEPVLTEDPLKQEVHIDNSVNQDVHGVDSVKEEVQNDFAKNVVQMDDSVKKEVHMDDSMQKLKETSTEVKQIEDLAENVSSMTLLPSSSGDNEERVPKQVPTVTSTTDDVNREQSDESLNKPLLKCDQSLDLNSEDGPKGDGVSPTEVKKEVNAEPESTQQTVAEIET